MTPDRVLRLSPLHLSLLAAIALNGNIGCQPAESGPAAPVFTDGSAAEQETARTLASGYAAPMASRIGGVENLRPVRIEVDELQMAHVRLQQTYGGVPVFGGELFIHMDSNGELSETGDHLIPDISVDPTPTLTEDEGIDAAVMAYAGWQVLTDDPEAELVVLRQAGQDFLTWKVQLRRIDGTAQTAMPVIFIDAHDGSEVWRYNNLKTAILTGASNYSGTVTVKGYKPKGDSYYYLEDVGRHLGTYSMANTYDTAYYVYDTDTAFTDSSQAEAVDAHYAGEAVYDYYKYVHGWMGVDGANGPGTVDSLTGTGSVIALYVNYGVDYANAFWDGYEMVFGDGDGVDYGPMTTVDITGHEMTHGVTSATAAFTYYGESGALDEGYADIFGAMVERRLEGESTATWTMAEDCYTPVVSGDALRYLYDPALDGYTVDYYADLYLDPTDDGGVHTNMGIPELAFYLLSKGGRHPEYGGATMAGVGADKASLIAFRALKHYLGSDSDMADARNAWLDSAADLYGAGLTQYKQVMKAWNLVGVGVSSATTTCTGYTLPFSGTLTSGAYKFYTKGAGAAYGAGTFSVKLEGPTSADFDLFLQSKNATTGAWATVAKSKTAGTSSESLTYSGDAGTYRMYIKASSGSGDFVACMSTP